MYILPQNKKITCIFSFIAVIYFEQNIIGPLQLMMLFWMNWGYGFYGFIVLLIICKFVLVAYIFLPKIRCSQEDFFLLKQIYTRLEFKIQWSRILWRWQSRKHQEPISPTRKQLQWQNLSDITFLELWRLLKACNFMEKA